MIRLSLPQQIWHGMLPALGRRPRVYAPFSRWRYGPDLAFGADTEIVIEGFPRSANSFAVNAFKLAQNRPVAIAHHLHAPAQVISAVRAAVPAVVLVREPRAAIVSYLLWQPHVGPRQACRNYLSFYEALRDFEAQIIVADFAQVTSDFGAVIARVNERFGTRFKRFKHSDENVQRCFGAIERDSSAQRGSLLETVVARPSTERQAAKRKIEATLTRRVSVGTLSRLDTVYSDFQALSADSPYDAAL